MKIKKILTIGFIISFSFLLHKNTVAYPGEIIKSLKTPGNFPTGLAFDSENLWIADRKTKKIYCINPKNEKIIKEIDAPGYWPMGLAWDGQNLWNADVKGGIPKSENYNGVIYKINPKNGTILKQINAPTKAPRGLAWDGKYLWCVDEMKNKLIKFSSDDGTTIADFDAPSSGSTGLTFDGKYLWISDRKKDEIYMVDPKTGKVLLITEAPGKFTRGLAFDGKFLWANDYADDKIFKLSRKDNDKYRTYKSKKMKMTFTYQITNLGPGKVKNFDVFLPIPQNRPNQKIIDQIQYSSDNYKIVTDQWGQKCANFNIKNINAGKIINIETVVKSKLSEVRYYIFPDQVGNLSDIPKDIKNKFLADNEKYQINNSVIKEAVKKAVGNEKNPYWIARKIFDYIIDKMHYEMVGGWNTAPTVLERGSGSCSEYTFVFISMCRAAGLPARYVGSVVIRGDDFSMDDVFHRWAEIYLPNYGWIPVDPSGGDQKSPRNQTQYFGHLSNRFLITTQGGGNSNTMGWTYNSNEKKQTEPKTFVIFDNFADWELIED